MVSWIIDNFQKRSYLCFIGEIWTVIESVILVSIFTNGKQLFRISYGNNSLPTAYIEKYMYFAVFV